MATKANNPSGSSFHSNTAEIFTTDVKANAAYRINDAFSVGAAVGVAYAKIRMTSAPYVPAAAGNYWHELQGDAWTATYSLGATFKPFEGTTVGIGYRSGMSLGLEGTETLALPAIAGGTVVKNINADLDLPGVVTVGLTQEVTEKLTLMATYEWTNWSSVKDPIAINNAITAGSTLHLGYEDSWYVSAGAEYDVNDKLTVRTGVGYEKSPIPVEHRNLRLPDADRIWASIGASYQVNDHIDVDVGYSHLFIRDVHVHASRNGQGYAADASSSADIFSASLRYNWKSEPMFEGDEPFARKY